jgi:hypothetical protein
MIDLKRKRGGQNYFCAAKIILPPLFSFLEDETDFP